MEWYGNPRGYNISYRPVGSRQNFQSETINNPTGNAYILANLEEYTQYEVLMSAVNDVGSSESSSASIERTREAGKVKILVGVNRHPRKQPTSINSHLQTYKYRQMR